MIGRTGLLLAASTLALSDPAAAQNALAAKFGTRENVVDLSLSPDGQRLALVTPGAGQSEVIKTIEIADAKVARIGASDGDPLLLRSCGWSSPTRLVCNFTGSATVAGMRVGYSRNLALDRDGGHTVYLGRTAGAAATRIAQFDGNVIDWRSGDGWVLMTRNWIPEATDAGFNRETRGGLGVELVDTVSGKAQLVEPPHRTTASYIADGQGNVRIRADADDDDGGLLTGLVSYSYKPKDGGGWRSFSKSRNGDGLRPIAVDGTRDIAYAVQSLDGRDALYSVALDGSMKTALVSSDPKVDVDAVISIGRHGRVIGATYITDRRQVDYFDPAYRALAASLKRALPQTPSIYFIGADADEKVLLIYAGSDTDPGRYYLYTKATRHLDPLMTARPELEGMTMAPMKAVTFPAADGTSIPAYLTLPPGGLATNLPAIVLPHGGPASRDDWGFDWLVQYLAQSGYAVLQPEFRGSSGYGDAWFAQNGFRSWQTAIGDVLDAGRWLAKQGIAAPGKLAILGWSYGGYAALQANVVDPSVFKAAVAIAPVTDLGMLKDEAKGFASEALVAAQVGSGSGVADGSPARHANRFAAPVLLFHGDRDTNVGIAQSRAMDAALRKAGKSSTLVEFPGLDHQLRDGNARARMLDRTTTFLAAALAR